MPLREIYVKLVIGFPRDPKVRALARYGADAGLARDLYVQMLLYCKENLTDGFIPAEEVGVLAYPLPLDHCEQLAKQLASVGLTKEVSKNEAHGWEVLAFVRRNGTREDVEALSAVRADAGRTGGIKSRKPAKPAGQRTAKASGKQVANQTSKQTVSQLNPETDTSINLDARTSGGAKVKNDDDDGSITQVSEALAERAGRPVDDDEARDVIAIILDRAKTAGKPVHHTIPYVLRAIKAEHDVYELLLASRFAAIEADAGIPPWCGDCDERTRQIGRETDNPRRCPDCHPETKAKTA